MEQLEKVIDQLVPLMDNKTTAQELWANDYEPHHRHFRKVIGKIAIEYRETQNTMYEFVAAYRVNGDK